MREHADITADVGQREQAGAGHRAAGAQVSFVGVEPDRAAAGKDVDRLIGLKVVVELRID